MLFHIEDDILTIRLEGAEQFWAIKRQLKVSKAQITELQWHETLVIARREIGFRVGTAIPGGLWAGRYYSGAGKNFLYVQKTRGLLGNITMAHVLVFRLADSDFQHLYLTVNDPDMAEKIIAWWSGND